VLDVSMMLRLLLHSVTAGVQGPAERPLRSTSTPPTAGIRTSRPRWLSLACTRRILQL